MNTRLGWSLLARAKFECLLIASMTFSCGAAHRKSVVPESRITWDEIFEERTFLSSEQVEQERYVSNEERNSLSQVDSRSATDRSKAGRTSEASHFDLKIGKWVRDLKLERPREYEGGVYGKVGSATVYISSKSKIPDFDRLYWVMVKVLSEKYGCFIVAKSTSEQLISVLCKDKRRVVFKRSIGLDWIMFYGRQYDHSGQELIVASRETLVR